jgi:hypothetical protein
MEWWTDFEQRFIVENMRNWTPYGKGKGNCKVPVLNEAHAMKAYLLVN